MKFCSQQVPDFNLQRSHNHPLAVALSNISPKKLENGSKASKQGD